MGTLTLLQEHTGQRLDEIKEVEAVLASPLFARSRGMTHLLRYICDRYFHQPAAPIKEYCIALDALGKTPDFDPKKDATVRVEAHRLRKKLAEYYAAEGARHRLQITLPPGSYVPRFVPRPPASDLNRPPASIAETSPMETCLSGLRTSSESSRNRFSVKGVLGASRVMWISSVALTVVGLVIAAGFVHRSSGHGMAVSPPTHALLAMPAAGIRILCGASINQFQDRLGVVWHGDRCFRGGHVFSVKSRPIFYAADPAIFLRGREGDFAYDIPAPPGTYELWLYFAETKFGSENSGSGGETTRLFDIVLNGQALEHRFDVISDADGFNTADIKVYTDVHPASDGKLHLELSGRGAIGAFLNAIEIRPGTPARMRPLRIAARATPYVDQQNREWSSDRFVRGGRLLEWDRSSPGAGMDALYASERYGHFTYSIPVARGGRYTAKMYFCENWFTIQGQMEKGNRLFDLFMNGQTLLRHFDLLGEGSAAHAVTKIFRGLQPTAQSKLVFDFVPVRNYAEVNAIEISDDRT